MESLPDGIIGHVLKFLPLFWVIGTGNLISRAFRKARANWSEINIAGDLVASNPINFKKILNKTFPARILKFQAYEIRPLLPYLFDFHELQCIDIYTPTDLAALCLTIQSNMTEFTVRNCWHLANSDLAGLTNLTNLTSLSIACSNSINEEGLAYIGMLGKLEKLVIKGFITLDIGLSHLGSLVRLKHLDLTGCFGLTNDCLERVGKLTGLTELILRQCYKITDVGLSHLGGLSLLQSLDLGDCRTITDVGLWHLGKLVSLTKLSLLGCTKLTDEGIAGLESLSELRIIDLAECVQLRNKRPDFLIRRATIRVSSSSKVFTRDIIGHILGFLAARWVIGIGNLVSREFHDARANWPQITSFSGPELDAILAKAITSKITGLQTCGRYCLRFAGVHRLRYIDVVDAITDEELEQLHMPDLTELYLRECRHLTDKGFRHIGIHQKLTELYLRDCWKMSDDDFAQIGRLTNLRKLHVDNAQKLTDDGLAHIGRLTNLNVLFLSGCSDATDAGLVHIGRLTKLVALFLHRFYRITSAGLGHLRPLRLLRHFDLAGCVEIPRVNHLALLRSFR